MVVILGGWGISNSRTKTTHVYNTGYHPGYVRKEDADDVGEEGGVYATHYTLCRLTSDGF